MSPIVCGKLGGVGSPNLIVGEMGSARRVQPQRCSSTEQLIPLDRSAEFDGRHQLEIGYPK